MGVEGYLFGGRGAEEGEEGAVLAGILRSDEGPRNCRPGGWRVAGLVDVAGWERTIVVGVFTARSKGDPGVFRGSGGLAGHVGGQLLDGDRLPGVQQVVHVPQRLLARWRARVQGLVPIGRDRGGQGRLGVLVC